MEIEDALKDLLRAMLIDNLEIDIETPDDQIEVSLILFGETISSSRIRR